MKTNKLRVLIVEDSEDDFSMLLRELYKSSYEIEYTLVEDAINFKNALKEEWDVIISDYLLPSFTGRDALKLCNEKGIDTPFIMVSGAVGEDIAVYMMKLGAKDYIMKNSLARLLPAIERELEDAKTRKERRQAEESLIVSEKLYHNLFDKANEGLILITFDGKLAEVNQAFADMHGYSTDELIYSDINILNVSKGNVFEEKTDIIRRLQAGEVVRFEVEHYHKDGHVFPLSITASIIDIGARFYLVFYQDITERKEVEATIKNRIADLEWFNNISVGRELKMIELKKEINELLKRLGEEPKYEIYT